MRLVVLTDINLMSLELLSLADTVDNIRITLLPGDYLSYKNFQRSNQSMLMHIGLSSDLDESDIFSFEVDDDQIQDLVTHWNQLSEAKPKRLFVPSYRLRFFEKQQLVLNATVSWECNLIKISGSKRTRKKTFPFDGESDASQQLLAIIRSQCSRKLTT